MIISLSIPVRSQSDELSDWDYTVITAACQDKFHL